MLIHTESYINFYHVFSQYKLYDDLQKTILRMILSGFDGFITASKKTSYMSVFMRRFLILGKLRSGGFKVNLPQKCQLFQNAVITLLQNFL